MDELISREELKKHKFSTPQYIQLGGRRNGKTIERITLAYQKGWNDAIDAIYDNAPTVPLPDFKDGYKQAIIDGKTNFSRPQGEWEIVDAKGGEIWNCVCTECGHDPQEYINGTENWWLTKSHLPNFCPNCGVRIVNVKGGKEE